jgi:hypothetical protein
MTALTAATSRFVVIAIIVSLLNLLNFSKAATTSSSSFLTRHLAINSDQQNNIASPTMAKRDVSEISDATSGNETSLWDGSDEDAFAGLDHPGYSFDSDPENFTGGWHAHRKVWEAGRDGEQPKSCWIKEEVMPMITKFDYKSMAIGRAPRILVIYGSLRPTSFSKKAAYEFARLLDLLGCDVRIYNPKGLPVRDPALENEIKVLELRALTHWSDGHMWVR